LNHGIGQVIGWVPAGLASIFCPMHLLVHDISRRNCLIAEKKNPILEKSVRAP
jgi:hypothetical protein